MLEDIKRINLKNGMTVLLRRDKLSPLVAINLRIKSGFLREPDKFTGISHLLEHMLFKSTRKLKTSDIKEQFRNLGGVFNGATAYEYTIYYCTVPKDNLEPALKLEADLIYNPLFDPAELKKEKQVVIQEVKRKDDLPSIFAWEKMMELSFTRHPFGRWRIGTEENISKMRREDIFGFHSKNYSPHNSILTIVGDFDTQKITLCIKRHFEKIKNVPLKKITFPLEPKQKKLRYNSIKGDIKQTHLKIGFHAPGKFEADNFPLTVLSYILGGGDGSRLNQILKDKYGLVNSTSSDLYNLKNLGVFFFELELENKNTLPSLIESFKQIEKIKQGKIFDSEIIRAKNLWLTDFLSQFEELADQADNLSFFQQYGDYKLIQKLIRKIKSVNKKDIQEVAKSYLDLDKASVLKYSPNKDKMNFEVLRKQITKGVKKGKSEFEPPKPISLKKLKLKARGVKPVSTETLDYGTYLICKEKHNLPLVSIDFYFKGGRRGETQNNCGITQLLLENSLKKKFKGQSLTNQLEYLGGSLSTRAEPDFFGYSLKIPAENIDGGLNILFEILQNPVFKKDQIDKRKRFLIAQIKKEQDDMRNYPLQLLKEIVFPDHPYANSQWGNEENLKKITIKQLENWHKTYYIRPNLVVSAVGDFKTNWLKKKINSNLRNLSRVRIEEKKRMLKAKTKAKANIVLRNKYQTAIACGFPTCGFAKDDLYPLKLIQAIFSGMGGRLFKELREKRGLAYTVRALNDSYKDKGIFYSYIGTSPKKEKLVIDLFKKEFEKIKKRKVGAVELRKSKAYLSGAYHTSLQTNSALAHQYAKNHILGKNPFEVETFVQNIKKITPKQIQATALKYFNWKDFHLAGIRGKK